MEKLFGLLLIIIMTSTCCSCSSDNDIKTSLSTNTELCSEMDGIIAITSKTDEPSTASHIEKNEYIQLLDEDDVELDGVLYIELSPEQVIRLYGKYSCDNDIRRMNVLCNGGYSESTLYMMLSDITEIKEDTEIHNNEYSDVDGMSVYQVRCKAKFSDDLTIPNEPVDYFTYVALQNDGKYWRICKIFTGL